MATHLRSRFYPVLTVFLVLALAPAAGALVIDSGTAPEPVAAPAPVPVIAAGNAFASPALIVPAGTTIQWEGLLLPHTVTTTADVTTAVAGTPNDAGNADADPDTFRAFLPQGAAFTHTFDSPGVFTYYCEIHRQLGMVGTIVVQ